MAFRYRRYVPVAQRQAKADKQVEKLRKKGGEAQPVHIDGTTIARSFWGKGWCKHLESFSDYSNRLPRGRTYARNGSVRHLDIKPGKIEALVAGSSLYRVSITIKELKPGVWKRIKEKCAGQIGSMLELLQGKLSNEVMTVVGDRAEGLFPQPGEIKLSCSCPDWATMCKHVASALYGVGNRLDTQPELLFLLRDVDAQELIAAEMALPGENAGAGDVLGDDRLGDIFGIDFAEEDVVPVAAAVEEALAVEIAPAVGSGRGTRKKAAPRKKAVARKAVRKPPVVRDVAPVRLRPSGKSVTRLRKKLGMSQAEFASAMGVSAASVRRWESLQGPLGLQQRTLQALAALHERSKAT